MHKGAVAWLLGLAFRLSALPAVFALSPSASASADFACIAPILADQANRLGYVGAIRSLPGARALIGADNGLFLAENRDGSAVLSPVDDRIKGVLDLYGLTGNDTLIAASSGWFVAHMNNGRIRVEQIGVHRSPDTRVFTVPGGDVLIAPVDSVKKWVEVRDVNDHIDVQAVTSGDIDTPVGALELRGAGLLIGTPRGLFLLQPGNGRKSIVPVGGAQTGPVTNLYGIQHNGVLVNAVRGWFLASAGPHGVVVSPIGGLDTSLTARVHDFGSAGVMVETLQGLRLIRIAADGAHVIEPGPATIEDVSNLLDLPKGRLLIRGDDGLYVARATSDGVKVERVAGGRIGEFIKSGGIFELPGTGVLVEPNSGGWLLVTNSGNGASAAPVALADIAAVRQNLALGDSAVLIQSEEGRDHTTNANIFLARMAEGHLELDTMGKADLVNLRGHFSLPGFGEIVHDRTGLFVLPVQSLSRATVAVANRDILDRSAIDPQRREFNVEISVSHACATAAENLRMSVRVTAPNGKSFVEQPEQVISGDTAVVKFPLKFDAVGDWSFQLTSALGETERPVGAPQTLTITSGGWLEWIRQWWSWVALTIAALLIVINALLFVLARYSALAWRIATGEGLSTSVLRIGTFLLSYFTKAQLWILDLYYREVHEQLLKSSPSLFLAIPLSSIDGAPLPSTDVLSPPWARRRRWIQGGSGMGKTSLFRHVVEAQFRAHETAFAAFADWGCIVVAFAARDFAASGEDKDDPAWVVDAVRATLSSRGLTFDNDTLLSRFLQSGVVAVAIDGLNEVDRNRAVSAFTRAYSDAPVLVTSQQIGNDRFENFRLPPDMRAFVLDLLLLYLPEGSAKAVFARIQESGLKDAIRSGYDVRLIIDLARSNAQNPELPKDRLGLYAAVIEAGWPDSLSEPRLEQQSRTAAAAWRMVSERRPSDDMRRIRPNEELELDLLNALADAPELEKKPVRLLRRVGGAFEFVHDQMHAYLASRWFTQEGFSVAELVKMIASSTIWTQTPDARRALWEFSAAMLDDQRLIALWKRVEDNEEWDVLRRSLKAEAEQRGLSQTGSEAPTVNS
jgi:hypothetical protein